MISKSQTTSLQKYQSSKNSVHLLTIVMKSDLIYGHQRKLWEISETQWDVDSNTS